MIMAYFKLEFGWGKRAKAAQVSERKGWECVDWEVERARERGRYKTASNYLTAARSWTLFVGRDDWRFSEMNAENLDAYQRWLSERGICANTISAYMRALRAIYRRVITDSDSGDCPFEQVFTGRAKTRKRSLSSEIIQQLHALPLPEGSSLALARDIFLFGFYAMGMPFVDIAYLRKSQIREGFIRYARHKTGQQIQVALLPNMLSIIERYQRADSEYVFPILAEGSSEHQHRLYRSRLRQYNYSLHRLGQQLPVPCHLSSYVVRHSWASIAYQHHLDISLIGKALGHTKTSTTLLYIKSLADPDLADANHSLMQELGLAQ